LPATPALASTEVLRSFPIDLPPGGNLQPAPTSVEAMRPAGPCIIFNNLPVSDKHARVRGDGHPFEIHVDTRDKGASPYSSITPLLQLPSPRTPEPDWFFPWRAAHPFPTELSIRWDLAVRRIEARTAASHAYGHPTLEFIDIRSGRHLYFTVLAYGTIEGGDYLAPDVASQIVIVGTTPRAANSYGRSAGTGWARVPRTYSASTGPGERSQVDFRMDVGEFRSVLDAGRRVDARLSADPADYVLDNYHFNNEVVNDGEIALNLAVDLRLLRS
jgi:hypothetical protein